MLRLLFFFALSNGNTCLYSPECTLHQLHLPPPNLQPPSVNTRFICFSTKKRANQKFTQKEDLKNFRWRGKGFLLVAGGGCASSLATDLAPLWKPKEILKIHTTVGDPNHVFLNLIIMFCWTWSWDIMGYHGAMGLQYHIKPPMFHFWCWLWNLYLCFLGGRPSIQVTEICEVVMREGKLVVDMLHN